MMNEKQASLRIDYVVLSENGVLTGDWSTPVDVLKLLWKGGVMLFGGDVLLEFDLKNAEVWLLDFTA